MYQIVGPSRSKLVSIASDNDFKLYVQEHECMCLCKMPSQIIFKLTAVGRFVTWSNGRSVSQLIRKSRSTYPLELLDDSNNYLAKNLHNRTKFDLRRFLATDLDIVVQQSTKTRKKLRSNRRRFLGRFWLIKFKYINRSRIANDRYSV